MWTFWIVLALVILFLVWVAKHNRHRVGGTDVTSERHRKTGGYSQGN
jgi:hypothetical protein